MRFHADGPWLPDELLVALEEGRAIFFCGAGVSRAKAKLPDFFGLAKDVLRILGAASDDPARQLLDKATAPSSIPGVGGLVAADRIFALLERNFTLENIAAAVGEAIRPTPGADLSAHKVLLSLSKNSDGNVRLITTNFDLLFEACAPRAQVWTPNRLPDLGRLGDFEGIVHLHGMFDQNYTKPVEGNLVLSIGEFGRAYLSEGWATNFIRDLISKFVIIFIGYSAEDPPLHYFLEAVSRKDERAPPVMFAFQSGSEENSRALWQQKGVRALSYSPDNEHEALWKSLRSWEGKARNPASWQKRLIRLAQKGPQTLQPHERGQVVHLALTDAGSRTISQSKPTLPASWLYAFDPNVRYALPTTAVRLRGSSTIDPFDAFGLDSDPRPAPPKRDSLHVRREVPPGAIDVLAPLASDGLKTPGKLRGHHKVHITEFPSRLKHLAIWLSGVCDEPAAIWWAANQQGLHPALIEVIRWALENRERKQNSDADAAWGSLFEAWREIAENDHGPLFAIQREITKHGWTDGNLRRFSEIARCRLIVRGAYWRDELPPMSQKWSKDLRLFTPDIYYPDRHRIIEFSDNRLADILWALRQNLEYALNREMELHPYPPRIVALEPEPSLTGFSAERSYGLNAHAQEFVDLFRRLSVRDPNAAMNELRSWRIAHPFFERMRVWAVQLPQFLEEKFVFEIFDSLTDEVFWGPDHQRDLLLSLLAVWNRMPDDFRLKVERRLVAGPKLRHRISREKRRQWAATDSLERIIWLEMNGCSLANETVRKVDQLRRRVPSWNPVDAQSASRSREARSGAVHLDTSLNGLDELPIGELVDAVVKSRTHIWGELREHDPFIGLCTNRPVLTFAALLHEVRKGNDVAALWNEFLGIIAQSRDASKLNILVALRLLQMPDSFIDEVVTRSCFWLSAVSLFIHNKNANALYALMDRLIRSLARVSGRKTPSGRRNWGMAAASSPAGALVSVLCSDPSINPNKPGFRLMPEWLERAMRLIDLPDDFGMASLVEFSRRLDWLYRCAPVWTEENFISEMHKSDDTFELVMAGFSLNPYVSKIELYTPLKQFVELIITKPTKLADIDRQSLADFFVHGWLTKDPEGLRWLSSDDFRRVIINGNEEFRQHIIWRAANFREYAEKIALLNQVWPRQLSVRSPSIVSRLCNLALQDAEHFSDLAYAIMPLVTHVEWRHTGLLGIRAETEKAIKADPEACLALLTSVISDDARAWPYDLIELLNVIVQERPSLAADRRMIKLKRLWTQR